MIRSKNEIPIYEFPDEQLEGYRVLVDLYEAKYHKSNIFISGDRFIKDYNIKNKDGLARGWYTLYLRYNIDNYDRYDIDNMKKIILDHQSSPYDRDSVLLTEANELLKELIANTKDLEVRFNFVRNYGK